MLIIDGNAVYEIDCDCIRKKKLYKKMACHDIEKEKNAIEIQTGGICREKLYYTGKGVTVAVLDTGIYRHPDFGDRIIGWYDAIDHLKDPKDPNGHGTQEEGKKG